MCENGPPALDIGLVPMKAPLVGPLPPGIRPGPPLTIAVGVLGAPLAKGTGMVGWPAGWVMCFLASAASVLSATSP